MAGQRDSVLEPDAMELVSARMTAMNAVCQRGMKGKTGTSCVDLLCESHIDDRGSRRCNGIAQTSIKDIQGAYKWDDHGHRTSAFACQK
jgi:hypothetical protein